MSIKEQNNPTEKLYALAASNARLNKFTENLPVRYVKADIRAAYASINRAFEAVEKRFAAAVHVPGPANGCWITDISRCARLRTRSQALQT